MRLTTALEERNELRNSVHFNQINVRSWDTTFLLSLEALYFELIALYLVRFADWV